MEDRSLSTKRRRPRAARACDACRIKKNKCDDSYPCSYCRDHGIDCLVRGQDLGSRLYSPEYVRNLEEKVKTLTAKGPQPPPAPEPPGPSPPVTGRHNSGSGSSSGVYPNASPSVRQEIVGINSHTRNVEFYGNSSALALLSHVQRVGEGNSGSGSVADAGAFVTNLHNTAFSPDADSSQSPAAPNLPHSSPRYHDYSAHDHRRFQPFVENYFSSLHFIHPFLDREEFSDRVVKLWSTHTGEEKKAPSFRALYFGILSLGALIGPRQEHPLDGVSNQQWSRFFFHEAYSLCNKLGMVTDLDTVQCYFILAKVCQNELNPHWSYMFVGLAVRTALAMGINRQPSTQSKKSMAQIRAESRTWWGLYSLETEMSFSMGRPDTLGADIYHNRGYPCVRENGMTTGEPDEQFDPPFCAIIKSMVDLSQITRRICQGLYLAEALTTRTVSLANELEQALDRWVADLPGIIRPSRSNTGSVSLRSIRDPLWAKRQRLVLGIRYHNLRILTFGSFLLVPPATERDAAPGLQECVRRCIESAQETIEIIHVTYQHHDFFHTWFYNTTYIVFAASVILVYAVKEAAEDELESLFRSVGMAIEVLETMEECLVALKAAKLLQRAMDKTKAAGRRRQQHTTGGSETTQQGAAQNPAVPQAPEWDMMMDGGADSALHLNHYWGPLNLLEGDVDFDFSFPLNGFNMAP